MMSDIFTEGSPVSVDDMLMAKDRRVAIQMKLLNQRPDCTLVNFKCNIPGPIKNNAQLRAFFDKGCQEIQGILSQRNIEIVFQKVLDDKTGSELFLLLSEKAELVKQIMVELEETTPQARLYDSDVLVLKAGEVTSISRKDLGYGQRQCLICDQPAKACGRNRTHSMEEMYEAIGKLITG